MKSLPANEREALAYIDMLGRTDSVAVATAMADFIAAYPQNVDVLVERAAFYASRADYEAAESCSRESRERSHRHNGSCLRSASVPQPQVHQFY